MPRPERSSLPYPVSVNTLIDRLATLPGIGRRTAERLALHLLKASAHDALALARAIEDAKTKVRHCATCFNLADEPVDHDPAVVAQPADHQPAPAPPDARCAICRDDRRDRSKLLVVEQPRDLIALEHTGLYRGLYHVLMGRLDPLEGLGPESTTAEALLARIIPSPAQSGNPPIAEVILGLSTTIEGDGTTLYLQREIARVAGSAVRVTRLARGLPTGAQLDLAPASVLAEALIGRQSVRHAQDS